MGPWTLEPAHGTAVTSGLSMERKMKEDHCTRLLLKVENVLRSLSDIFYCASARGFFLIHEIGEILSWPPVDLPA